MTNIKAMPLHELKMDLAVFESEIEKLRKQLETCESLKDKAILEDKIYLKAEVVTTIHEELARRQHPEWVSQP